jgi:hypothetical protein
MRFRVLTVVLVNEDFSVLGYDKVCSCSADSLLHPCSGYVDNTSWTGIFKMVPTGMRFDGPQSSEEESPYPYDSNIFVPD